MMAPPSAAYFQQPGPLQPPHQHHPIMPPMHMYGPHHAAAAAAAANGGGISWGADVRQIDRTGQTLECIDSETVVSGLTMPTWSAQRPWEAPIYDTPYPDDPTKASSPASASHGSKRSGDYAGDDGTVKTHWTFWDKPRNRRLCIPFTVLFLAAIGVVVGVMVAGKGGGGSGNDNGNGSPLSSTNPALGNGNTGAEEPTMAPTRSPRGVGGVIVATITDSPTISRMTTTSSIPSATPTTAAPTATPTQAPSVEPGNPTKQPSTSAPTVQPSPFPTKSPSESPTTSEPTKYPSPSPTFGEYDFLCQI